MILIAESGSTKTQWCLIESKTKQSIINSLGINPLILSDSEIENIIKPIASSINIKNITEIHFFGAGCSTQKAIKKVENQLAIVFKCKTVYVDTDLKAACYALAGNKAGIIGLLGTGSNSCLWDGSEIAFKIPSLGYILGDEGGGVSIGKQLIIDFVKKQMPENIYKAFLEEYNLTTELIIEKVYSGSMPNRFLAGFAPFAEAYFETEYCKNIVFRQLELFFKNNILIYDNAKQYDLYFCGTIAFYHRDILADLCKQFNLNLISVIKEPITELIKYFSLNIAD